MADRVIYVHPGETVEFRVVGHQFEKNNTGWRTQSRPDKLLVMVNSSTGISLADPAAGLEEWSYAVARHEAARQKMLSEESTE